MRKSLLEKDKLASESDIYKKHSELYDLFSQAEDAPEKVVSFFKDKFEDQIVLDFGCGTGKYIQLLSPHSNKYIAVDPSDAQLRIAKNKAANLQNVEVSLINDGIIPLDDDSIDIVFSSWVLGGIQDIQQRKRALDEIERVLRPGGIIYLIENDIGGDFKSIVEMGYGDQKTRRKLTWFNDSGFQEISHLQTSFEFSDLDEAKRIFQGIWGNDISNNILSKSISHNLVILERKPNFILDSTKFVIDNADHVTIQDEIIEKSILHFKEVKHTSWLDELPFDVSSLKDEEKLMFSLVFNAISFSYWGDPYWNVEYRGNLYTRGSLSLAVCIFRSIEERQSLLDPSVLRSLDEKTLSNILRGNTKIPLLKERLNILNEVGNVLSNEFDDKVSNLLTSADLDAIKIAKTLEDIFPNSFEDKYLYKNHQVYFLKRAQAFIHTTVSLFGNNTYGKIKNIEHLTALADYIIPNVLRNLKIIKYSGELKEKIDNEEEIDKGSNFEIEIRAAVVWSIEKIRRELLRSGFEVSITDINDSLWIAGGDLETPFHKTRTTAY